MLEQLEQLNHAIIRGLRLNLLPAHACARLCPALQAPAPPRPSLTPPFTLLPLPSALCLPLHVIRHITHRHFFPLSLAHRITSHRIAWHRTSLAPSFV